MYDVGGSNIGIVGTQKTMNGRTGIAAVATEQARQRAIT